MQSAIGKTLKFVPLYSSRFIHTGCIAMSAKVAVILSGCGVYDGSEVHEASACLVHLSRAGADVKMYAPDVDQMHTIDHTKGEEMQPNRNVLCESARIARGNVSALSQLNSSDFDALVFPGGFGAAKNLSTWATENVNCSLNPDVERVIKSFHADSKPIGMACISPVLAAKCLPGVEITVGHASEEGGKWPYAGTVGALEQCGAKHVQKDVTEVHVDAKAKLVTTPAYMCNTAVHEVFDGVGVMISTMLKMTK